MQATLPRDRTGNPPRTKGGGVFPDGRSALMLVAVRLRHVVKSEWRSRRYLDVTPLEEGPYR